MVETENGIKIYYDDADCDVINAANKLLEQKNSKFRLEFDNEEHDGFSILNIKEIG